MRRRIVKIVIASTVAILGFLNFGVNTQSRSEDTNLAQEAKAYTVCTEYYFGEWLCCYSVEGYCTTGNHGNMHF